MNVVKMKLMLGIGLVSLGLLVCAFKSVDKPVDFSGSWLLNAQQCEGPEGAVPRNGKSVIRVIQQQPLLIIEKSMTDSLGKTAAVTDTVVFGKARNFPVGNGQVIEKTLSQSWSKDRQVMTLSAKYAMDHEGEKLEFNGTETWKLSADGKVLTIVSETVMPDRTDQVTLVYTKI